MPILYIKNFRASYKCHSRFFDAHSVCDTRTLEFISGVNVLTGDIDTGGFCISYALSMLAQNNCDGFIRDGVEYYIDGEKVNNDILADRTCYIDESNILFQTETTVEQMIFAGLKKYNIPLSSDEIRCFFKISPDRYIRPLRGVGNERYKCMVAIAYANRKTIYCFPWISKKQMDYYGKNILDLLELLNSFDNITIVPTNKNLSQYKNYLVN